MINSKNVNIKHLIYFSKPTIFDETHTNEILQKSRENNQKHGITGSLVCRSDLYFQFLEGPIEAVDDFCRSAETYFLKFPESFYICILRFSRGKYTNN